MSNYAELSRAQLASLIPELLMAGQLIDRSGMAWAMSEIGTDVWAEVAIDEWAAASPIYTRRMQRAFGFEGDDLVTIFKGLQLDIGAPPQFLDMRFTLDTRWSGRFALAHCGALCDVQPMGEDYVRAMCHDVEDPTFDATAIATNPRAQVRPVHRPPEGPAGADGGPACEWTVVIDESFPEAQPHPNLAIVGATQAAGLELAPIDPGDAGISAYDGPLLADIDFGAYSHSALVRMADEVALQSHLLNLSFVTTLRQRADEATVARVAEKQLVGWAGAAATRLARWIGPGATVEQIRRLHPLNNPATYVDSGLAARDDGWFRLDRTRAEHAIEVAVNGGEQEPEVAIVEFSSGMNFEFETRKSLPLFVV